MTGMFRPSRCFLKAAWVAVLVCLAVIPIANAFERGSLKIDQIQGSNWSVTQLEISLTDLTSQAPKLSLDSGLLHLPKPFKTIHQIKIQCSDFVMQAGLMACKQGKGRIDWPALGSPRFDWSFTITDQGGVWTIKQLKLWGGYVSIRFSEKNWHWQVKIQASHLSLASMQRFFKFRQVEKISGQLSFNALLMGHKNSLHQFDVKAQFHSLGLNAFQEKLLTEESHAFLQLFARKQRKNWSWKSRLGVDAGGVFYDPVFLSFSQQQPLSVTASGLLHTLDNKLVVNNLLLKQADSLQLTGSAIIQKSVDADLKIAIYRLHQAAKTYLSPFLETGPLADLQLFGQMQVDVRLKQNQLDAINAILTNLKIQQPGNHIDVEQLEGGLNWRRQQHDQASFLQWRKMIIKKIPIEPGRLDFTLYDKQMALLKPAKLSLLSGVLSIRDFRFQAVKNDDAKVFFEGEVNRLSLEKLTEVLDWTPLSGTISGYIPAVHYQDKTLKLDGQLAIQVFGGEIIVKELSSSGLFGFSPKLHTDIVFNHLDLKQITQKFQMGRIEGRLSGFAHNVYLENWQPVTFYAWLGTPDNDDSRHRISQKAVENIASLGGGGAADVISRGFLRFFDTFSYDKLGFGCYLHNGVCQMMGVEAAENGYYLIKGGGLPRIDVIGYNPRLDWNVLIQRLKRISSTDEIIVQ
jgi:hypothetical protein